MAVSLPTAEDVRKAREQAAKTAAERAELARTPFFAALGAGDVAVAAMTKAVTDATQAIAEVRARAAAARTADGGTAEAAPRFPFAAQLRGATLPHNTEELRTALEELRVQVEKAYAEFAERGEQTWGRIRTQPGVQQAVATFGSYTEKLDARVDHLVEDARDAGEKALGTVSRQTRSTGEKVARSTQRFAAGAAQTVGAVSRRTSDTVAAKGAEAAEGIAAAGDDVAHDTRSATRKLANRTTPRTASDKAAARKPAARKPAARRAGPASADTSSADS